MITAVTGVLARVLDEEVRLQAGPFEYAVLVPEFVRRQLQTRLGEEVSAHLGVDVTTLPVTTETLSAHRYVDADIALDELTERGGGRLIGVTGGEQRLHVSASELLSGPYSHFAPGPVSYESRDVSATAQRRVV